MVAYDSGGIVNWGEENLLFLGSVLLLHRLRRPVFQILWPAIQQDATQNVYRTQRAGQREDSPQDSLFNCCVGFAPLSKRDLNPVLDF